MAKVMRPILTFFAPLLLSQLLTPLLTPLPSVAQAAPEPLRIGGSSTVFPVVQTAIEAYQKGGANRQVRFELKETGTSAGFRQFFEQVPPLLVQRRALQRHLGVVKSRRQR
jgi:ABC-type phosphate transport system substrate-binding protein